MKIIIKDENYIEWLNDRGVYRWKNDIWMSEIGPLTEQEINDLYPSYLRWKEKYHEFKNTKNKNTK